ncbi:MAG: CDP-2,3-bis-(O-geranylgeranyl)-sn-glycerol synthase [Candidatus Heimdallarchaeota archaeon]
MTILLDIGLAFMFAVPIFISNAVPALLGGGYPVDCYKTFFDKKRILGDHKTVQGLISGLISGIFASVIVWFMVHDLMVENYALIGFQYPWWIGVLMGWGTNFGDMLGSFIKRRIKIKPGRSFPVFDQMGYMVFGILWSWPIFKVIPWQFIVTLIIIAPLIHVAFNLLGYALKVKDVPF